MNSFQSHPAHIFAQEFTDALKVPPLRNVLKGFTPYEEHKQIAPDVNDFLEQFIKRHGIESGALGPHYDWEGNGKRKGKQAHSYPLLGTYAHPDSAVLRPFRCAFEFDREHHPQGVFFKQALLKTAVHVLSGAYDAAILIFLLKDGSSPETYLNDGSQYTQQLRQRFEEQGIYVCPV